MLLRDVARVEDGAEDVETLARYNGRPAIAQGVMRKSGENTVAIVDDVYGGCRRSAPCCPRA